MRVDRRTARVGMPEQRPDHLQRLSCRYRRRANRMAQHMRRHAAPLQSGVEVNVIRSWLGHASINTTNGYIEIDLAMKRKALEVCEVDSGESIPPSWQSKPDILAWLESL